MQQISKNFGQFKFLLAFCLIFISQELSADNITSNNGQLSNTNASIFATQSGYIAGAAQACGQDVSIFLNRANEALDRIAFNSADKVLAMARLQASLQQAQQIETNKHPLPCSQVIQDFNSLPIMQNDYRQSVIGQLSPTMGMPPQPDNRPIAQLNPNPPATIGNNPPPNINTLAPGGTPPPPDFPSQVPTSPSSNIIYQTPGIAPGVDTTQPAPNINNLAPNPLNTMSTGDNPPPTSVTNPYAGVNPNPNGSPQR